MLARKNVNVRISTSAASAPAVTNTLRHRSARSPAIVKATVRTVVSTGEYQAQPAQHAVEAQRGAGDGDCHRERP